MVDTHEANFSHEYEVDGNIVKVFECPFCDYEVHVLIENGQVEFNTINRGNEEVSHSFVGVK